MADSLPSSTPDHGGPDNQTTSREHQSMSASPTPPGSEIPSDMAAQYSFLQSVLRNGSLAELEDFISANPLSVNKRYGDSMFTPIMLAIYVSQDNYSEDHIISYCQIITATSEFETKVVDRNGRTALHHAAELGLVQIAEHLLRAGADANATDATVSMPLHYAVAAGKDQMIEPLLLYGANIEAVTHSRRTPLHLAAQGQDAACVMRLIANHAKVSAPAQNNITPLHGACEADVVRALVSAGAYVNERTKDGFTPLHLAARYGRISAVMGLLSYPETAINATTNIGSTPLQLASLNGRAEILTLLLEHKADVNFRQSCDDATALHVAKNQATAMVLLQAGADIKAVRKDGMTPLHRAVVEGRENVVDELLKSGANPMAMNQRRETPLKLAQLHDHRLMALKLRNVINSADGRSRDIKRPTLPARPSSKQDKACKDFEGLIWMHDISRSEEDPYLSMSVHDMLYGADPKLSHLWPEGENPRATWVHFPYANRTWVEDAFRLLYQHPGTDGAEGLEQMLGFISSRYQEQTLHQSSRSRKWHLISNDFLTNSSQNMLSIILPILDTDLREPVIRRNHHALHSTTATSSTTEKASLKLTEMEEQHLRKFISLKEAYPHLHDVRTLDEWFHENLDPAEALQRNKDQVLSRYISRHQREKQPRVSADARVTLPNPADEVRQHLTTSAQGAPGGNGLQAVTETPAFLSGPLGLSGDPMSTSDMDLEHGHPPQPQTNSNTLPLTQMASRPFLREIPEAQPRERLGLQNEENRERLFPRRPSQHSQQHALQQLVSVPQLWIWRRGNVIITCYPDRQDCSSEHSLTDMIISQLATQQDAWRGNTQQNITESLLGLVVAAALQFTAEFPLLQKRPTVHDAFSEYITYISKSATTSYYNYRDSLKDPEGSVAKFSKAIEEETGQLIDIDDVLLEISMIQQVYKDVDEIRKNASLSLNSSEEVWEAKVQGIDRLEKDASRVRKMITTLLDLRQRQASTENSINSTKQSKILFNQSKVLMIFTGATVVFTPLSWISSVLALKIHNFTPQDEWWRTYEAFIASFVTLLGTFLLCGVFLKLYDRLNHE